MTRYIFGHPIRKETTALFHDKKISLEDFVDMIKRSSDGFKTNMEHLGDKYIEERFPEEWLEVLSAWMDGN
jgi:hypothetical protein